MHLRKVLILLSALPTITNCLPVEDNSSTHNLSFVDDGEFEVVVHAGLKRLRQLNLFAPASKIVYVEANFVDGTDHPCRYHIDVASPNAKSVSIVGKIPSTSGTPQWDQPVVVEGRPLETGWEWATTGMALLDAMRIVRDQGVPADAFQSVDLHWPVRDYLTTQASTEPWYKFILQRRYWEDHWYVSARTGRSGKNFYISSRP